MLQFVLALFKSVEKKTVIETHIDKNLAKDSLKILRKLSAVSLEYFQRLVPVLT